MLATISMGNNNNSVKLNIFGFLLDIEQMRRENPTFHTTRL